MSAAKKTSKETKVSAAWGRPVAAALSAGVTGACFLAGLCTFFTPVQAGIAGGIAAALVVTSPVQAAVTALAGLLMGGALAPSDPWALVSQPWYLRAFEAAAVAAIAAFLLRAALRKDLLSSRVLLGLGIAMVVGNLWATTLTVNAQSTFDPTTNRTAASFNQQIEHGLTPQYAGTDDGWFFKVYRQVESGRPFYASFHEALDANPRWKAYSVADFRMPTLFWLWHALPGPQAVVWAFLLLASLAVAAVIPLNASTVRLPLALPAAAALGGYFVFFPIQIVLFSQEQWAATVGICSLAAHAWSASGHGRYRTWTVVAVVLAVVGVLMRETLAFLPIAGLVASAFAQPAEKRFRLWAWGGGLAALAALYALHAYRVAPYLLAHREFTRTGHGGVAFALAAFTYATEYLGAGGALTVVLGLLGLVGAAMVRPTLNSVMVLVATVAPLVAFLFVGNGAWVEATGELTNYWGATVIPLLLAVSSSAFAVLPSVRVTDSVWRLMKPAKAGRTHAA